MEKKFRFVKEHLKNALLVGNSWRLISMVREHVVNRSEIMRRARIERDNKQRAGYEIRARIIKTF